MQQAQARGTKTDLKIEGFVLFFCLIETLILLEQLDFKIPTNLHYHHTEEGGSHHWVTRGFAQQLCPREWGTLWVSEIQNSKPPHIPSMVGKGPSH